LVNPHPGDLLWNKPPPARCKRRALLWTAGVYVHGRSDWRRRPWNEVYLPACAV